MSAAKEYLQKQLCDLLDRALIPPSWYTGFPAEGAHGRGCIGLKLGCGDILMHIVVGNDYDAHDHSIWTECKTGRGRLSDDQKDTRELLRQARVDYVEVRSLEEAITKWTDLGVPLRKVRI